MTKRTSPRRRPLASSLSNAGVWRLLDANVNRAREGLRVIEDTARFVKRSAALAGHVRKLRHQLDVVTRTAYPRLLEGRDSVHDVGKRSPVPPHKDFGAVVAANFRRGQEALRVLEEYSRHFAPNASRMFKRLRFELYTAEKTWGRSARFTKLPCGGGVSLFT